jgi:hypothetical protein
MSGFPFRPSAGHPEVPRSYCRGSRRIKYYQGHLTGDHRGAPPIRDWKFQPAPSPAVHQVDRLIRLSADEAHAHVTGVVVTLATGEREWNLREFVEAILGGERFVIREGGYILELEPMACDRCGRVTIGTLTRSRKG